DSGGVDCDVLVYDGPPQNGSSGGIDVVDGELHRVPIVGAELGSRASHGSNLPDIDRRRFALGDRRAQGYRATEHDGAARGPDSQQELATVVSFWFVFGHQ